MRVNDYIERIRTALSDSPIANFGRFSNLGIIFRAMAIVSAEQEERLINETDSFYIQHAEGADLDRRAADFNLFRKTGTKSYGSIFVTPPYDIEVPVGLILTDAAQSLQFETTSRATISAGETKAVRIQSLSEDLFSNLPPTTNLFSTPFPTTRFVVGESIDPVTNQLVGGLVGATDFETDEAFRARVLSNLISRSLSSRPYILSKLREVTPSVWLAEIETGGYLIAYTNSTDSFVIQDLELVMEQFAAAGIRYQILTLESFDVDIEIIVRGGVPPSRIKTVLKDYFETVRPGLFIDENTIATALSPLNIELIEVVRPIALKLPEGYMANIVSVKVLFEG